MRMTMSRETVCDSLALGIGLGLILPFFYMLLSRAPVTELLSTSIMPDALTTGQQVTLMWRIRELRAGCSGEVHRRFIDKWGRIVEFKPVPVFVHEPSSASGRVFLTQIEIPRGLAPGEAHYEPIVKRWCNWAQHWFWPMYDPPSKTPFMVVDTVERNPPLPLPPLETLEVPIVIPSTPPIVMIPPLPPSRPYFDVEIPMQQQIPMPTPTPRTKRPLTAEEKRLETIK